ncbi:hypothetical protein HAX54_027811 [Datura stramonium]|uniref:Uncharacterized protein n=1 Tax=Datura stramonium TaxID=4076 RepID=A0ABS8V3E4_DATST|nr:hypothetical protein [Datura stramonium]
MKDVGLLFFCLVPRKGRETKATSDRKKMKERGFWSLLMRLGALQTYKLQSSEKKERSAQHLHLCSCPYHGL